MRLTQNILYVAFNYRLLLDGRGVLNPKTMSWIRHRVCEDKTKPKRWAKEFAIKIAAAPFWMRPR